MRESLRKVEPLDANFCVILLDLYRGRVGELSLALTRAPLHRARNYRRREDSERLIIERWLIRRLIPPGQPGVGLDDSQLQSDVESSGLRQLGAPCGSHGGGIVTVNDAIGRHILAEVGLSDLLPPLRINQVQVGPGDPAIGVGVTD